MIPITFDSYSLLDYQQSLVEDLETISPEELRWRLKHHPTMKNDTNKKNNVTNNSFFVIWIW